MRRVVPLLTFLLLACGVTPGFSAERWGRLYTLTGEVVVREKPSDAATQARLLKAGQKVRVDARDETWAAVYDPREQERDEARAWGFARLSELRGRGILEVVRKDGKTTSIEVRRPDAGDVPRPAAKPEAKPAVKPEAEPAAKPEAKSEAKAEARPEESAKPAKPTKPMKPMMPTKPAAEFGELRVADRRLMVRAAPDKDSAFRRLLQPGQKVRVDFHTDGWYAVFDPAERIRELPRAWGYGRDKYLVPEAEYSGPPPEPEAAKAEPSRPGSRPDDAVGYAVLERKDDTRKAAARKDGKRPPAQPAATLRVRLDLAQPPAQDTLRKIVREIWKAERRKNEDLRLEVLLQGMDAHGLAYAVARFHEDGRVREFWWREVVLGKPAK